MALVLLWSAWFVNAAAMAINQVVFSGRGIGPGPALGSVSLGIQAVALAFIQRGDRVGLAIAVLFALIAALPMAMMPGLLSDRAFASAASIGLSFVLKLCGTGLLLTPDGMRWFARE
jgi:hypothetical protein